MFMVKKIIIPITGARMSAAEGANGTRSVERALYPPSVGLPCGLDGLGSVVSFCSGARSGSQISDNFTAF